MIKLENWKTDFSSDKFGTLVATQNIDFDDEGYLQLAGKPVNIYNQDDSADFSRVFAIEYFNTNGVGTDGYLILTRDRAFLLTLANGPAVSSISGDNIFSNTFPDLVIFNGLAHFSGYSGTTINSWTGAAFTERITGLTSSVPQPMCVFENRNELAVGNANTVKTYNTSYTLQNTLTLPADYQVYTMRWEENKLFIGTRHKHGGEAKIFVWNGATTSAQAGYGVRCPRVYSLCKYKSGIVAITSAGQMLRWTGGGFDPLKDVFGVEANFPVWYTNKLWQDEDTGTALISKVFDRGSIADGDLIYINVSSPVATNESDTLIKNFPSGIWVFDPRVGLYHKALPSADKIQTVAINALSSSVITTASAIHTVTGEPVFIESVGDITGISVNQTYYAIKVTTTTFKLAYSPADAHAGDFITLGGAATSSPSITVAKNNQIGSVNDSETGPICLVSNADIPDTFLNSPIIWGGRTYKVGDVDATYDSLNILSQANNVGYFITPKIYSQNVTENWQRLLLLLRNLNLDEDKVVIKYRTTERFGMPTRPSQGTYTSSTVLGGTNYYLQAEEGDEVVITKGYGAGRSAHITNINGALLTIDEAMPNVSASNELEFYVSDFKKLGIVTNASKFIEDNYSQHLIGKTAPWIQFKIELRGAALAIEQLRTQSTPHKQ